MRNGHKESAPTSQILMAWRRFKKVNVESSTKDKQIIWFEHKLTESIKFLDFVAPKMKEFVLHQFIVQWQDLQFKPNTECL